MNQCEFDERTAFAIQLVNIDIPRRAPGGLFWDRGYWWLPCDAAPDISLTISAAGHVWQSSDAFAAMDLTFSEDTYVLTMTANSVVIPNVRASDLMNELRIRIIDVDSTLCEGNPLNDDDLADELIGECTFQLAPDQLDGRTHILDCQPTSEMSGFRARLKFPPSTMM